MDVRRAAAPVLLCALLAGSAGCGSGDGAISAASADELRRQVTAVRAAIAADRGTAAATELAELRTRIQQLVRAGELNAADSEVLLAQVEGIATSLGARASAKATPKATPTRTAAAQPDRKVATVPATVEKPDANGNGKAKGKKKDKGNG